jgi:hypothetical protein
LSCSGFGGRRGAGGWQGFFGLDKSLVRHIEGLGQRLDGSPARLPPAGLQQRRPLAAAIHVLADVVKQGWRVRVAGRRVEVARPNDVNDTGDALRERVRSQLHAERDEQLRQGSVREFIRFMEARRFFEGQFVSIFSLMRDGRFNPFHVERYADQRPTCGGVPVMACAVQFMQWDSYVGSQTNPRFFDYQPLTFNSRQERLHQLQAGDRLCLVCRCPDDAQYYLVAVLHVSSSRRNPAGSEEAAFGEFAIVADPSLSQDLGKRFPAEGLLRAFQFDPSKAIKHGASIGQALQTLRFLEASDERILDAALSRLALGNESQLDRPCGLWTKCNPVFADYFLANWKQRHTALAFLLYDPPPALGAGMPVFIHSENTLRLLARFREGLFVAGHKFTADPQERAAERERVWTSYRLGTIDAPTKEEFDAFWEGQHGVRGLFLMDKVEEVPKRMAFKAYGRALEWGYPSSVGYRYLSFSQTVLLLRGTHLPQGVVEQYLEKLLRAPS